MTINDTAAELKKTMATKVREQIAEREGKRDTDPRAGWILCDLQTNDLKAVLKFINSF